MSYSSTLLQFKLPLVFYLLLYRVRVPLFLFNVTVWNFPYPSSILQSQIFSTPLHCYKFRVHLLFFYEELLEYPRKFRKCWIQVDWKRDLHQIVLFVFLCTPCLLSTQADRTHSPVSFLFISTKCNIAYSAKIRKIFHFLPCKWKISCDWCLCEEPLLFQTELPIMWRSFWIIGDRQLHTWYLDRKATAWNCRPQANCMSASIKATRGLGTPQAAGSSLVSYLTVHIQTNRWSQPFSTQMDR